MVDENLPNTDDSDEAITVTPLNASELETQDVWEATLPPLTDIAGENLARIAESQLGYSESIVNFVHAEDGETHNGYTRYGAWYGNPYGEWNTMFTYFCLNYAGVSSDDIPYGSGCWAWSLELDKAGLIVPVTRGSPARGDILLIDSDLDGKADRSSIVQSVSDNEISAVEGDIDGSVALTSYLIGDEQLLGMVSLADIVPEPPVLPDEPAEVDFSAESESGICVEAHADRGAFPPDTEMFVFDISQDEAVQAAADHFGDEAPDDIQAVAVDITFRSPDGEELEPAEDSQVRVSIVLPEEQSLADGEFSLLHVSDDGDVQEVADACVSADGAEFVAEAFSVYIVTKFSDKEKDQSREWLQNMGLPLKEIDGKKFVPNSKTHPYLLRVGDEVRIYSDDAGSGFWTQYCVYSRTLNEDNSITRNAELIADNKTELKNKWAAISRTNEHPSNWTDGNRLYAEFKGIRSGYAVVHHTINGTTEDFWIRVLDTENDLTELDLVAPQDENLNHADMEIADDGKYTITKTEYINGVPQTRIEVYDAFVCAVNQADVFGADPNSEPLASFYPENYEQIGAEGGEQYELTSAFKCWWRADKQFNNTLLDHVVFDVDIRLTPAYYYIKGQENTHIPMDSNNKTDIQHVIYNLQKRDIIDAINKCPMSNGLDFTVRANAALVKLQAEKYFDGAPYGGDEFDFELSLYDTTNNQYDKVATLKNDANGEISFTRAFSETGTYTYKIKETSKTDTSILYDDNEYTITVEVTQNAAGYLIAEISYPGDSIPVFNNYQTYTLPATGGTGELPYILFGSAMLSGAFILLLIRRKKEGAH
ncbi:MAG: LPXTG cell wall anchor domain-containing protein [Ruminococcus sp.]|nr:LPXTG cell wall anchor domain-containing protein [Ruminococcus sp.]